MAREAWGTAVQWAASHQLRDERWKSLELTICTCLCSRLSVCTRSVITAQLMHGTAIARLSSPRIPFLLSAPLVPKGDLRQVKLPPVTHLAQTLPRHFSQAQAQEHPAQHADSITNLLCEIVGYIGEKSLFFGFFRTSNNLVSFFIWKTQMIDIWFWWKVI